MNWHNGWLFLTLFFAVLVVLSLTIEEKPRSRDDIVAARVFVTGVMGFIVFGFLWAVTK